MYDIYRYGVALPRDSRAKTAPSIGNEHHTTTLRLAFCPTGTQSGARTLGGPGAPDP